MFRVIYYEMAVNIYDRYTVISFNFKMPNVTNE